MNPERWEQVKDIVEAALEHAPNGRDAFLHNRCAGDPELRGEVELLLAAHDENFLERRFASEPRTQEWLPPADPAVPGARVGAYEILGELGRGGMGSVYLAVRADQEFKKRVAIKLIRRDMLTATAVRRFRNERQILATLEHPNIARLIDGGTTPDGIPYFVMEYVEGAPLLEYCKTHSLSLKQRLEIYPAICCAVHHAHRRMIIHRDLKPGNILVDESGTPKLLDFGIAKLLDSDSEDETQDPTLTGMRAMTPAYASPEQVRGDAATVRSDIYSLGVILLELVTGQRARGWVDTSPTMGPLCDAITQDGDLLRIAHRATRQAPEERYETVGELSADVESYLAGIGVPQYQYAAVQQRPAAFHHDAAISIAVLPLRRLSPESAADDYLGAGIADAVITKLSNVARIVVRPTSTALRYAETHDPVAAGREMGVDFVLEGTIQKPGNHVRVTVQLVRVASGAPVWAAHFDQEFQELLKLEDSISGQVALALIPHLSGEERQRLARQGTADAKAHEAYLRGRWHWNTHTEEGRAKALVAFMEAIARDPKYALAHAGVADYYLQLAVWGGLPPAESFAAAKDAAARALAIDPDLGEAHASLAFALWAYDRDYQAAAHHFQMAIALNPDYPQAHHWFGLFNLTRGDPLIAVASVESARKFDPHSPVLAISLGFCLYHAREYERAIRELLGALAIHGADSRIHELLAWCYLEKLAIPECLEAARRAVEISQRNPFAVCTLSRAEAAAGNRAAASALVDELTRRARERRVSGCALGCAHLGLGHKEQALKLAEQAWHDRDWWTFFVGTSPQWDPLRDSARFQRLLESQGTPELQPQLSIAAVSRKPARLAPRQMVTTVAAVMVLLAVTTIWRFRTPAKPFETTRLAKITTNGTALRAVISPDGREVAYVTNESGKAALWLRKTDSPGPRRLAGPLEGEITSLNFTDNGARICFVSSNRNEPSRGVLYRVPLTGGGPQKMMADVPGSISPSMDGSRVAFLRRNADHTEGLYIAQMDGNGERQVATRHYPERFAWDSLPAWSADGKRLAIGIEGTDQTGFYVYLMVVNVGDGATRILRAPRWQYLERIAWLARPAGVVVIGQDVESSFQHIWYVPYPSGAARRINNDLSDYIGVNLTADGKTLASVQFQTLANVYIRRPGGAEGVQVTPGLGRYFDLSWTPDGRIVYASDASGSADIWMMNADGTAQQQLTAHGARNYAPAVSPDGNWIAFHSSRSGNWNIWRMGLNGVDPRALTSDRHDSNWPRFTPDGKYVVYHNTGLTARNIWKVPVAGGTPLRLTDAASTHPAVSPKDGRIACWYSRDFAKPSWKLAVLPPEGGTPLRTFDLPPTAAPDTALVWTPAGDGITFIDGRNGASNLWVQPVDGGPPRPLTSYTSGQIYSFDWARDGRLAYSRGISSSDVVMIHDTN